MGYTETTSFTSSAVSAELSPHLLRTLSVENGKIYPPMCTQRCLFGFSVTQTYYVYDASTPAHVYHFKNNHSILDTCAHAKLPLAPLSAAKIGNMQVSGGKGGSCKNMYHPPHAHIKTFETQ